MPTLLDVLAVCLCLSCIFSHHNRLWSSCQCNDDTALWKRQPVAMEVPFIIAVWIQYTIEIYFPNGICLDQYVIFSKYGVWMFLGILYKMKYHIFAKWHNWSFKKRPIMPFALHFLQFWAQGLIKISFCPILSQYFACTCEPLWEWEKLGGGQDETWPLMAACSHCRNLVSHCVAKSHKLGRLPNLSSRSSHGGVKHHKSQV